MLSIFLSFVSIFLFAFNTKVCNGQSNCKDAPFPYKYSSDGVCSSPRILNSTLPTFPAALKTGIVDMTIDFEVKFLAMCPAVIDDIELFGLTVNKADGTLLQILRLYYSTLSSSYVITGSYGGTVQTLRTVPSGIAIPDPFHIFMKMTLTSVASDVDNARGLLGAPGIYRSASGSLAMPTTIKFDSTTKFFFCTDSNKDPHAYCQIMGFATWYAYETASNGLSYFSGLYPIPVAFYKFSQGSGYSVPDSYNNLGPASLGISAGDSTTSPVWSSDDSRIEFKTVNQYVNLPIFQISRYNEFRYSFSVSFWAKVKVSNSGVGYFLNYAGSDAIPKFSIVLNNFHVYGVIGPEATSANSRKITLGTWTLISVLFLHTDSPLKSFMSVFLGTLSQGSYYDVITPLISPASGDFITLGPFADSVVSIYNLKIFSPGAYSPEISSTCSTPTSFCDISLGPPNVQNCITCKSNAIMKNFGCYPECYTYSDGLCQMQCSYPYIPRNETYMAYCDFKCSSSSSNKYLYANGSCLSTCISPLIKYQNLTDEWYCKTPCADSKGFYLPDQQVCLVSCSDGYEEDYSTFYKRCLPVKTSETIKTTIEVTGKAGTASRAVTQATAALSSGSPTGISASVAGKIFTNIKYLNISYSVELLEALESWGSSFVSLGFLPDLPMSISEKVVERPVPYMFEKYEVGSSFLLNFWDNICFLIILTTLFIIVICLEFLLEKCSFKKYSVKSKLGVFRAMIQNFILTQLYSVYGDIVFYSTLEYRSIDFSLGLTGLSFSLSLVFLCLMLLSFGLHFFLLKKYQRIKNQAQVANNQNLLDQFVQSHQGNFVLFKDFKDNLIIQQSFLLLLTARDLASSLVITTMFLHPLAQTIVLLVLNLSMVAYLIWYRPFDSLFDASQQLFYEIITLSVNVGVLMMAVMDAIHTIGYDLRRELGKFLIIMNMIFNFGALGWMLIKGFMVCKEIYDSYKEKKKQQEKRPKLSDLPLQGKKNTTLNSQPSLKSKQITGLENSVSTLFEHPIVEKQEDIVFNSSVNQALSLEESASAIELGWENAHSSRLIRIHPKKAKIKRRIKEE